MGLIPGGDRVELTQHASESIERLAKNWSVDRDRLVKRFAEIYEGKFVRGKDQLTSEEKRQEHVIERLSVEVAVDRDRFRKGKAQSPDPGHDRAKSALDLRLFDRGGSKLEPLSYSTGKDQTEVIGEILEAFESAETVFLKGVVGSGKSVIGIRTALEFGGGVVSVPTKVLSHQYRDDYEHDKHFLKGDGGRAEIKVLKGRGNFNCPYLEQKHPEWEYTSCQSRSLPCTRPLARGESRLEALRECPYWGFILPTSAPLKTRDEHVGSYRGLVGKHSLLLKDEGECPYWNQFRSYLSADVDVLNSRKWEIEARIGRLPLSEITVIDEADAWLDGLNSKASITGGRIGRLLDEIREDGLGREAEEVRGLWGDYRSGFLEPLPLAESLMEILEEIELGSNLYWQLKMVMDFEKEVVAEAEEDKVTYYIPDPKPVLSRMRKWIGGKWLMMSATVQDRGVLNRIYGIDPIFVEGEAEFPGKLIQKKVGRELKVNNRRWRRPSFKREYRRVRDDILEEAKRPGFVPVHATKYVSDHLGDITEENWKEDNGLTLSTKMDRGADLRDMRSVIVLKYPFPDLSDPLLRSTKKRLGEKKFWMYYRDISRREFIQQVGRTVRSPEDEVEFWSPDEKCHERLRRDWEGEIVGV